MFPFNSNKPQESSRGAKVALLLLLFTPDSQIVVFGRAPGLGVHTLLSHKPLLLSLFSFNSFP